MNSRYLKVQDHSGLVRDVSTGGIINVDDKSYSQYKSQRALAQQRQEKEYERESRINTLEKKLCNVESTLQKILEILSNGNS